MTPPARPTRSEPTVVGLHLHDDAARLVRLAGDGIARLAEWVEVPLPPGTVREGVLQRAGHLPGAVASRLREWVAGDPVRVVLASTDAVVVPLGATDPVGAAADRVTAVGAAIGDAVWADVVHVLGRPVGLAAARRSSVLRTREGLGRAGIPPASIDAAPVALAALGYALLPSPPGPWTVGLRAGGRTWRVTVGRGGRLEGGDTGAAGGSPHLVGRAGAGAEDVDLVAGVRQLLRAPTDRPDGGALASLALAVGAALAGLPSTAVASPDLGAAVVLRPLAPPADGLPRWAIEALPVEAPAPRSRVTRARRGTR